MSGGIALFALLFLFLLVAPIVVVAIAILVMGGIGTCLIRHEKPPPHKPSDIYFQQRQYISWSARHGWPRASNLFYECALCHKTLPSQSDSPGECSCGNLFITPDHIGAQNPSQVRLYEE